ncbi:MAG: OmpH family outer membrane protein [Deltaproteobacteria bacterium]|nr:OmpH family outer membrane protein [Deltaproteobacteria bacterium]
MRKLQIGIMAITLAVAFSNVVIAAELKIGYINLQRALNDSLAGKAAFAELEAETQKRQEKVDVKQEEIKKLNEEVEKKRVVWSEDMKEQKHKELQARMQEFQRFYLHDKGYSFIFESQGLIYGPPDADSTNELIKIYDDDYKKRKKDKK